MRTTGLAALVAVALAVTAVVAISSSLSGPARWTPDGLFYQARSLELRGTDRSVALNQTFGGALGAPLRAVDPRRSGDPAWVRYHARFYERRIALPAAAAALEPFAGDRALLDLSIAGYVVAVLAIFGLLLLRFRLPIAAAVAFAAVLLPALTRHSAYPLTDSWGLALETAAFAFAVLALRRGLRWTIPWAAAILLLGFTRDSMWIPLLAAAWLAVTHPSRVSRRLLLTGIAATLPMLLLFSVPMRELLATMLNDTQPAPDASWGFIVERYPSALAELLRANGGFVRDGEVYTAAFLLGGLGLLFLVSGGASAGPAATLLKAGAVAGAAYVLAVPIFSAFRLELVLVPMAAFGLGLGMEWVAARAPALGRPRLPSPMLNRP